MSFQESVRHLTNGSLYQTLDTTTEQTASLEALQAIIETKVSNISVLLI